MRPSGADAHFQSQILKIGSGRQPRYIASKLMSDFAVNLSEVKGEVLIPVRVTPRGRANAVTGARNGSLTLAVTAPPAEGAANAAVIQVLSDALRCPKSALLLRRGEKSRDKVVAVAGLGPDEVRCRLEKHL